MYSEFYSGALGVGSRPECGPVPRYPVGTTLSIRSLWIVYYVYAQCSSIYYVNRIVHAFTAAGVLIQTDEYFCKNGKYWEKLHQQRDP